MGLSAGLLERLRQVEELAQQRDFARAVLVLDQALQLAPSRPELSYRKAVLLLAQQRFAEAVTTLEDVLQRVPRDSAVHNLLGSALASSGSLVRAAAAFRRACELAPDRHDYWCNLGRSLDNAGDAAGACGAYDQAVGLRPEDAEIRVTRSGCLRTLGRIDEAAADLRRALELAPDSLPAWTGLVNLKSAGLSKAELERLGVLHDTAGPDAQRRVGLGFAYGQALEADGQYRKAFFVLAESNAAKARRIRWQPAEVTDYVDSTTRAFGPGVSRASSTLLGREVIFIIGMPRCGSSLVEQILGAHPDVEGAGELMDAHAVVSEESSRRGGNLAAWAPRATAADWTRLGRAYLDRTAHLRGKRAVFTDKQLDNWRYVGALHAMLPGARFIHCRRDPVETCWSCFKHNFYRDHAGFSYDLDHLARYWRDSMRLIRFWVEHYPRVIYDHVYEDFLEQPEAGVRRILDYCDLPFHGGCLRFNEAERSVRTASAGQVRQPLRRTTAMSAHYGELLDALRTALARAP